MNLYQRFSNTVAIILVVLSHSSQSTSLSTPLSIKLHDIKFNDLSRLDESTALKVIEILSTIGILKISGLTGLNQAQDEAFHSLSSCLLSSSSEASSITASGKAENNETNGDNDTNNDNQIFTSIMEDGTKRLTIGTKSSTPLNNKNNNYFNASTNNIHDCGKPSSSLRALVDLGTRQLFLALDLALSVSSTSASMDTSTDQPRDDYTDVDMNKHYNDIVDEAVDNHYLMKPYQSFKELINYGEHLEHIHTYYKTKNSKDSTVTSSSSNTINSRNKPATMSMHTDAGLLIAMTTGYYSSTSSSTSSSNKNNNEEFTEDQVDSDKQQQQQQQQQQQRGLFITLSTGEIVHIDESDVSSNDLIIMVGAGGAEWLNPYYMSSTSNNSNNNNNNTNSRHHASLQLRAVPHALVVELGSDVSATRNWYGKMFLPPLDAELYQSSSTSSSATSSLTTRTATKDDVKNSVPATIMTYKTYRDETSKKALLLSTAIKNNDNSPGNNNSNMNQVPVACGESISTSSLLSSSSSSSLSSVFTTLTVPVSCTVASNGEPGVMCWKQCMSTTALHCSSGDSPMCTDTVALKPVDGTTMCTSSSGMKACQLTCQPSTPSDTVITKPVITTSVPTARPTTSTQKPISSSTIAGSNNKKNKNNEKSLFCLTPGTGTSMSMSGFIFSASDTGRQSECFVYLFPSWSLDTPFKFILGCLSTILLGVGIHGLSKLKMSIPHYQTSVKMKIYLSIGVYFVQILLSYIVMLIAMTYNVELFFMVCIGLTIGYVLFHPHPYKDQHNNDGDNDSDDTSINDTSTNTTINSHNNNINRYNHIKTTVDNDNDSEHGSVASNSNMNSSLLASFMNSSSSSSSSSSTAKRNSKNNNNTHMITTHLEPCCQDLDYESLTPIINNNNSNNNNHSHNNNNNHSKNNGGKKNDNEQLIASSNSSSKSDASATATHNIIKRRNF